MTQSIVGELSTPAEGAAPAAPEATPPGATPPTGQPAEGDAPTGEFDWNASAQDLLGGKFKDAQALADGYNNQRNYITELKKGFKEVEAKTTAPEEYKIDTEENGALAEFKDVISSDDAYFKDVLGVFKEASLTQEQADQVLAGYLKLNQASVPSVEDELNKLGPNKDDVLTGIKGFAQKLNPEDQKVLEALTDTAAGTDFLYRHIAKPALSIPTKINASPGKGYAELFSEAKAYQKANAATIGGDKSQKAHYMGLMERALQANGEL